MDTVGTPQRLPTVTLLGHWNALRDAINQKLILLKEERRAASLRSCSQENGTTTSPGKENYRRLISSFLPL